MKKIFILLAIILLSNSCTSYAMAQGDSKHLSFKAILKKEQPKPAPQPLTENGMTLTEQANLFYSSNDLKKAFESLLAIPEAQRTAQDWLLLGNLLQDEGKTSDAIFMYQRANLVDSKYYKAYYNKGNIYLADEKPFMAIEEYRKANKANPEFAYAYYNLGCAYLQVGNLKKAKIAFLKAIELKNSEPDFYYNLSYTYKQLGNHKLGKQYMNFYNKAMEAQGN